MHLAISQNRALKIARLKVAESEQNQSRRALGIFSIAQERIEYSCTLPSCKTLAFPPARSVKSRDRKCLPGTQSFRKGKRPFYTSGTQLSQPLTQLIRIHDANRMAAADVAISRDDLKKAENEVALQVHSRVLRNPDRKIAKTGRRAADEVRG